jgi:hypothetical protein
MALINSGDNEVIKRIIASHGIQPPKFWVGYNVKFIRNWKQKHVETMTINHPGVDGNASLPSPLYDFNTNDTYQVHKKYLYNNDYQWWSFLRDKKGNTYYFFDECLISSSPTYAPRKFVYESFNEFNKQIK